MFRSSLIHIDSKFLSPVSQSVFSQILLCLPLPASRVPNKKNQSPFSWHLCKGGLRLWF